MSLPHAVLTSLIEKSSSGFELARRFDKSIGYFWHATHQQIYRELARMEAAGWIASAAAPDAGKTRKREYTVLPAGRTELARWASQPTPLHDLRDEFTVRLRADAALGDVDLRDELALRIVAHQEKLAHYQRIKARDFPSDQPLSRHARIQHMILKRGMMFEQAHIGWSQEMLVALASAD